MSGWELQRTRGHAIVMAAAKGCVVKTPQSNQLFIDLDSKEAIKNFRRLLKSFRQQEPCSSFETPSASGKPGHVHVVVTLTRCVTSPLEQIALQAFLGSDPMRELLNWRRLVTGVPQEANNILFEKSVTENRSWFQRVCHCVFNFFGQRYA